ncbi:MULTISPECIES: AbrB/MazE/SpoVT family DNA-binding domain-containing protein [unclassified Candidatus Tisiphia]|jgi:AbrB family looped-hinge helix DNA binding protein|uniref:AbrB/MazE/SpoVT family DNA-binding domain-containing protein n=1 Tax=unclassified Candidatus Tisiphia TaxID=2996318 RepID=UPI001E808FA1|nr:MAG: AbrB/MazE/SpoVT family DNA-binding domain-containing protein [Rickettsia endosymbiont of Cimex lectularius]
MKIEHSQMDKHGRILIPSTIRNSLNYKYGDTFVIRVIDDELHIVGINKEIKAAQSLFKKYNTSSNSAVDEFLDSRRIEANNENLKFGAK